MNKDLNDNKLKLQLKILDNKNIIEALKTKIFNEPKENNFKETWHGTYTINDSNQFWLEYYQLKDDYLNSLLDYLNKNEVD